MKNKYESDAITEDNFHHERSRCVENAKTLSDRVYVTYTLSIEFKKQTQQNRFLE